MRLLVATLRESVAVKLGRTVCVAHRDWIGRSDCCTLIITNIIIPRPKQTYRIDGASRIPNVSKSSVQNYIALSHGCSANLEFCRYEIRKFLVDLGLSLAGVLLWAGSPTAHLIKGPHNVCDDGLLTYIVRR